MHVLQLALGACHLRLQLMHERLQSCRALRSLAQLLLRGLQLCEHLRSGHLEGQGSGVGWCGVAEQR